MKAAIAIAALAISLGQAHAQRTIHPPVQAGETLKSYAWPEPGAPEIGTGPGTFICPGISQLSDFYNAESTYLRNVYYADPNAETWRGKPVPPPAAFFGCDTVPPGYPIRVIKEPVLGYYRIEVTTPDGPVQGYTMELMLTR